MKKIVISIVLLSSLSFSSSCHTMFNNIKEDSHLMSKYFKNSNYGNTCVVTERLIKTIKTILVQCDYQLDNQTKIIYQQALEKVRNIQDISYRQMKKF